MVAFPVRTPGFHMSHNAYLAFHEWTRHFRNVKVDGIGHNSYDDE